MTKKFSIWLIFMTAIFLTTSSFLIAYAGSTSRFIDIMNTHYGNVCTLKEEGFFTKTLRVDWTSNTVMLHTIKVLAEIGDARESLYEDGVRYLKFPNDAGGYNILDWKTGEKKSIEEKAPYYFD